MKQLYLLAITLLSVGVFGLKDSQVVHWRRVHIPVVVDTNTAYIQYSPPNPCRGSRWDGPAEEFAEEARINCTAIRTKTINYILEDFCDYKGHREGRERFWYTLSSDEKDVMWMWAPHVAVTLGVYNLLSPTSTTTTKPRKNGTIYVPHRDPPEVIKLAKEVAKAKANLATELTSAISDLQEESTLLMQMREAWKDGIVYTPFLDKIKFSFKCVNCPLNLAKPAECSYDDIAETLRISYTLLIVDPKKLLFEASPFQTVKQFGDVFYSVFYTGPTHIITDDKGSCVREISKQSLFSTYVGSSKDADCGSKFANGSLFELGESFPLPDGRKYPAVQTKQLHMTNHIYCFGYNITCCGLEEECPAEVITLPYNLPFMIDSVIYGVNQTGSSNTRLDESVTRAINRRIHTNSQLSELNMFS